MTRTLHLWLGRTIGLLLVVLALTGTVLAVDALVEEAARPAPPPAGESVADLAAGLARHGTLAQISVTPAGAIVARFSEPRLRAVVDPVSFVLAPAATPSEIVRLATEIHRTLAAGDGGRLLLAFATLCGLVSAATGFALARRRERDGGRAGRFHRGLGLAVGLPFVFSAVTGLGLAVAALRPLDVHGTAAPYPARLAEGARLPVGDVAALRAVAVADLEDLVLPRRDDPEDTYRLVTIDRFAHVDPVTGLLAGWRERPWLHGVAASVMRLHGGRGSATLATLLGLAAGALPIVAVSGLLLSAGGRRARRRFASDAGAEAADTIVLVGSEGGTTRVFAERLAVVLRAHGHVVHLATMNEVAPVHLRADRLLILTSTHGVGTAPGSADRFLERLPRLAAPPPFAVVGFGERDAARFCGYAEDVDAALVATGATPLLPLRRIHRRSETEFDAWIATLLRRLDPTEAVTEAALPPPPAPAIRPASERRVLGGPAMGSRWTATIHAPEGADLAPLLARLAERIARLEAAFTRFRPGSELLRLDAAPLDRPIALSDDMAAILAIGLDVGRRSGGAFDVGLAAEVAANGFGRGWAEAGEPQADRRAAHLTLELDREGRRLIKRAPLRFDLAGIAKGFAADALAEIVGAAGFPAHLVALDGELVAGAVRPDGRPWSIGVEAPAIGLRTTLGRLDLVERAVATSGDYRRFGAAGGHTIDPTTGHPATGGPASVSVLADRCATADAWATALMVTGGAGLAAARAAGVEAVFVERTAGAARSHRPTGGEEGRWREAHP